MSNTVIGGIFIFVWGFFLGAWMGYWAGRTIELQKRRETTRSTTQAKGKDKMSYGGEVIADSTGKWCGNSLRFATEEEAKAYVDDLMWRWTSVCKRRVVQSDDPVNYRWDGSRARPLIDAQTMSNLEQGEISDRLGNFDEWGNRIRPRS